MRQKAREGGRLGGGGKEEGRWREGRKNKTRWLGRKLMEGDLVVGWVGCGDVGQWELVSTPTRTLGTQPPSGERN